MREPVVMLGAMRSSEATLRRGPFTVADARQAGLRWDDLQTKFWRRLSRGQYAWVGLGEDPELKMRAVAQRLPGPRKPPLDRPDRAPQLRRRFYPRLSRRR